MTPASLHVPHRVAACWRHGVLNGYGRLCLRVYCYSEVLQVLQLSALHVVQGSRCRETRGLGLLKVSYRSAAAQEQTAQAMALIDFTEVPKIDNKCQLLCKEDGLLHTTCGTPNYVAPEVINDKGYDGATADLWSCGVILFVLMAGYLPFDETNLLTLYKKIHKADFTCPSWFSSSAKKLISRILDPKPKTVTELRITVPEILENDWFKKGYKPPKFQEDKEISLDDVDAVFNGLEDHLVSEKKDAQPVLMNAFELISMSQGLNLNNLFEKHMGLVKRETRFTSKRPAKEIISKIEAAAIPLGFTVKRQNYKMKLQGAETGRKGHLSVAIEVFEVAPSLFMVEVCKSEGDTLEFHKFYKNLSSGLKDIVWKSKAVMEENK